MVAAVRAEGRDVRLDGAELRSGWESVVLDTPDGWILRFPRDEDVPFERELALLDRLHDRLPAPIPRIAWTGRFTRFAAYRRLDGVELEPAVFAAAAPLVRDRVAGDLARFLAAMHGALQPSEIAELQVPPFDADGFFPLDLRRLPTALRNRYAVVRAELERRVAASPHPPVLLHNDFHLGNLVLDAPLGRLAGVWDFSCVATGEPAPDVRYLSGDRDLAARIASGYAARTVREIDLGLAAAALTLEEVSDALEEGRDPAPYLTQRQV